MDTIGKRFTEYLVNFDYLNQVIENYGFVQAPTNDIKKMGFSKGIGSFSDLFDDMEEDIESSKIKKADVGDALLMTSKEKRLSFFNNYFIYKKVHSVNASQEEIHYLGKTGGKVSLEKEEEICGRCIVQHQNKCVKLKNIRKKLNYLSK